MTLNDKLIAQVVERILKVVDPDRIILFGSAATDTMSRDSDIDLLVIERGLRNEREESIRLRKALCDIDIPVDVFAMTSERFEETKGVIGGLAYPANKYGKVIYEAACVNR
jgi:predicted nucleotidyltransferase